MKTQSKLDWHLTVAIIAVLVGMVGICVSFPTVQKLIDTNVVQKILPSTSNRQGPL